MLRRVEARRRLVREAKSVMKFLFKLLAILIFGPIVLGIVVVLAAAAVVAGPMLLEKAKEFLGMASGPQSGSEPA